MSADVHTLLRSLTFINIALLAFNLLPVYPLDGGQILGSLLWFIIGRARSLVVTALIGLAGVAVIALLALGSMSVWLGLIGLYVGQQCLNSLRLARSLKELAVAPTRPGFTCPSCRARPPIGQFWSCTACGAMFDVFDPSAGVAAPLSDTTTTLRLSANPASSPRAAELEIGQCPACHTDSAGMKCVQCNALTSVLEWSAAGIAEGTPMTSLPSVTRFRRPRAPSVAALVGAVSFAIVTLWIIAGAVFTFTIASRSAAGPTAFSRYLITAMSAVAALPAAGAMWLFVRYRRAHNTFANAMQRFHDDREQGVGA
jgi:hypothetical protein